MNLTRRNFLATGATFAALGGARAEDAINCVLPTEGAPALRVGVLSDIHITPPKSDTVWFEKALRRFDAAKVDAVLVTGDLTTWNKRPEFEAVAAAWFKVFPGDRRSDGVKIERLFITGNHDVDGFAYPGAKFKTPEEAEPESFFFHRDAFWRDLFGEPYEPICAKTVKGYTFVLRHWWSRVADDYARQKDRYPAAAGCVKEENPTPAFLKRIAADLPTDRPFFYVQHERIPGTVNEPDPQGKLHGATAEALAAFPNCLALSGHSHYSLTDERSIWQGAFTAVNCSCARGFAFTPPGRENGHSVVDYNRDPPFEMDKIDIAAVKQGMVMDVFADRIVFSRFDIVNDVPLGADWVVPLYGARTVPPAGVPKYDFVARAAAARAPQFAPDAQVTVKETADGHRRRPDGTKAAKETCRQFLVSFPPIARTAAHGRGFDFSVTAEMRHLDMTCVVQEKRVFSPNVCMADALETAPVTCAFAREMIPKKRDVRFIVRPFDCWGNAGAPIATPWRRYA